MIYKMAVLVGALAISGAAQAQSVNVDITGKSPQQVRSELFNAAVQACRSTSDPMDQTTPDQCVSATYVSAITQAKQYWRRTSLQARIASR